LLVPTTIRRRTFAPQHAERASKRSDFAGDRAARHALHRLHPSRGTIGLCARGHEAAEVDLDKYTREPRSDVTPWKLRLIPSEIRYAARCQPRARRRILNASATMGAQSRRTSRRCRRGRPASFQTALPALSCVTLRHVDCEHTAT
jgi:hypothetical protein